MKFYNTPYKTKQDFKTITDDTVTMYTCGPTVYDYPHIGNWYTFVRYDTLQRVLTAAGYNVNWIMNITDVGHLVSDADDGEDKLEKGARREGKTAWDVAKKYTEYFEKGLDRLNITIPTNMPKATDHIEEQIRLVKTLEKKGHTYTINDGVYFDVTTFPEYGAMAGLDLKALKAGARVEVNKQKKHPADFALWKLSPKDQKRDMEWESPWGVGFPGWHLECSAMSQKYLGDTIDIHAGGIDHIPVHHTNEIAQSEAATGKKLAHYWLHMAHILVDNKKMSKSAGTFLTLEDVEKKGFDVLAFRLMVLQSHYRTEAHFSWDNLQAAQNLLNKWRNWACLQYQPDFLESSEDVAILVQETGKSVAIALGDDLNTPAALTFVNHLIDTTQGSGISKDQIIDVLQSIDNLFGLDLSEQPDITSKQKKLIEQREAARQEKDFKKADTLREELQQQGIEIDDTAHGQRWGRIYS